MHDGRPYDRNQGQGQGHLREVDRQSPTGLILFYDSVASLSLRVLQIRADDVVLYNRQKCKNILY